MHELRRATAYDKPVACLPLMCGRFFRYSPRDELAAAFRARAGADDDFAPSYNIPPGRPTLAVRFDARSGERTLSPLHWGLIPHFATDPKLAWKLINARGETVDRLPSYRAAFARRRCLIPANGFFEWRTLGKKKQPYAFALMSQKIFAIAGIWENWRDPSTDAWVRSCAMITTAANDLVAQVHDRMPVILEPEHHARWLGEEPEQLPELKALLKPLRSDLMVTWPVTAAINRPGAIDDVSILDAVVLGDPA